jgi:phosphate transport system permease protein
VGLGAAIYLSEYASPRVRRVVKPALETLAGIPTVAIGFFGVSLVTPLLQDIWPGTFLGGPPGFFMAGAAGICIGLMIVPIIASISEDAMSSVPGGLREGAYALGASRMRVALRVVFPAALSGIVASLVLAVSRAVGETMIVLLVAGNTPNVTLNPVENVQAMTAFIGTTATGDIAQGTIEYDTVFAVGALLFVITLVMNLISIRFVRKYRQVYE